MKINKDGRVVLNLPKNYGISDMLYGRQGKERDSRRSFNRSEKNEVWHRQKGRCAACRKELNPGYTHYDHIQPWELGGKTIISNCQALCANCHMLKNNKDRLDNQKKKKRAKQKNSFSLV